RRLEVAVEFWPIQEKFVIARGAKTVAEVVVATIRKGGHVGRGEAVPYRRYGETVEGTADAIRAMAPAIAAGIDRQVLRRQMPPVAARNALDCALWDLEAKTSRPRAAANAGFPLLRPLETAFTLSLGTPEAMAAAASAHADWPLLKVKLGGEGDRERL